MAWTGLELEAADCQTMISDAVRQRLPEWILAPRRAAGAVAFWGSWDDLAEQSANAARLALRASAHNAYD